MAPNRAPDAPCSNCRMQTGYERDDRGDWVSVCCGESAVVLDAEPFGGDA